MCVCFGILDDGKIPEMKKLQCNTTLSEPFEKECQAYNFFCPISNVNSYCSNESCTLFLDVQLFVTCLQEQLTYFIHNNTYTCYILPFRIPLTPPYGWWIKSFIAYIFMVTSHILWNNLDKNLCHKWKSQYKYS